MNGAKVRQQIAFSVLGGITLQDILNLVDNLLGSV